MRIFLCLLLFSVLPLLCFAQGRLPIIDMHLHAHSADGQGPPPVAICTPINPFPVWDQTESYTDTFMKMLKEPPCEDPVWSPMTDDELMKETLEVLERLNIFAVVSGSASFVSTWRKAAPDRLIPGLGFILTDETQSPDELRVMHSRGEIAVLGEVAIQYQGIHPNDERMIPYWALAEELDIPVGIHIGTGPPGVIYLGASGYRAGLHSALTMEEVLVRHPKLRVYLMHAGYPMIDDLLTILYAHPQVYVDVGVIIFTQPRTAFYRYIERIVEAGFGNRIMFGSDQMVWPGVIERSINVILDASFLSEDQKRDILYNNAARFLRLSDEQIANHHSASVQSANRFEMTKLKRFNLNGTEIHYTEQGSGDPVVLIHGSLADYSYWEISNQVEPLSAHHHVINYSRRYNHPNQNVPGMRHSPFVEAEDLTHLLDELDIGPVHLVGHSYGAYTALAFALEHPGRVRSLVLAEAPILSWLPDIPGGEGIEERFMSGVWQPMAEAFRESDESGLEFTSQWYFMLPFSQIEHEWQTLFQNNVKEWRALAISPDTFPRLDYERVKAVQIPVLLLSGGKNAGGFNDLIDGHLERLIPGAERVIIPDASHEMFLDFPDVTVNMMLEFFRNHSP